MDVQMGPNDSPFKQAADKPEEASCAPRPSGLLMANSVVVILVSVFLVSFGITGLAIADPYSFLLGLTLVVPAAVVGVLEYAASFRQYDTAARVLRPIHTAGFIVCLMGIVIFLPRILSDYISRIESGLLIVAVLLFISLFAAMSELGYRRWIRKLELWQDRWPKEARQRKQRPFQVSILELLLAMNVVALVAGRRHG